ncbi:MAG: NAD-dependent epimerase/dehydratase family protein [Chitinophagales bacterium]
MTKHIILGAGGAIAKALTQVLLSKGESVRLVSRNPSLLAGTEVFPADITDLQQTVDAVQDSSIVYLCVGLPYDYSVWRNQWPKIMDNTIESCKRSGSRLVFFDNVYMYGKVEGWMTENTPYNPVSRKGDLRARIATQLMSEVRKENITAMIARSADFYGPHADKTSVPNLLVFANLAKNKKAQWLFNGSVRHSFTYTPDAAEALYLLAMDESSWNQVWHLPTAPNPLTGNEFINLAARALNKKSNFFVLRKWMIGLGGLFNKTIRELYEMSYQYQFEYLFDSSKFQKKFNYQTHSYPEGIAEVAATFSK